MVNTNSIPTRTELRRWTAASMFVVGLVSVMSTVGPVACDSDENEVSETVEEAGDQVEEAADETAEAIDDATDDDASGGN